MAKDILDAIRQAEEDAKTRESQAKQSAQKRIEEAKAEAQSLIDNAELNSDKEAQKRYDAARIEGDNEMVKARESAADKCADIKKTADKNRAAVINNAIEYILH